MNNGDEGSQDLLEYNRRCKQAVLDVLFREAETFYVHCMPNPLLSIGRRGLQDKEKAEGILLVFGPYSTRHLSWDDRFIYCDMQFGQWEHVSIPYECIIRMFDKAGHVMMQWVTMVDPETQKPARPELTLTEGGAGRSAERESAPGRSAVRDNALDRSAERENAAGETNESCETREEENGTGESRVIEVDFTKKKPR